MPVEPPRRLYGRRRGHRLRDHQADLVQSLLPRLEVPLTGANVDPKRWFDKVDDVWLEIGFGAGEHLVALRQARPDIGLVGCEPFVNGMARLLAEIDRLGLRDIRLLMADARDLFDVLADASIGRAFLLYPDPWPKKRHHKRRFVTPETLDQLARILTPGAHFHVATDIADYARWTLAHFRRHTAFDWTAETARDWRQAPEGWLGTRYEDKAIAAGRRPIYLTFRRK